MASHKLYLPVRVYLILRPGNMLCLAYYGLFNAILHEALNDWPQVKSEFCFPDTH